MIFSSCYNPLVLNLEQPLSFFPLNIDFWKSPGQLYDRMSQIIDLPDYFPVIKSQVDHFSVTKVVITASHRETNAAACPTDGEAERSVTGWSLPLPGLSTIKRTNFIIEK